MAPQYRSMRFTRSDAQATALLRSAGFARNAKGLMAKGGKTISLTITDPTDFPDYMTDDQIIADATVADPYDPASSYPPTNEVVLTHLRPAG
jgi:hypothetical protein